MGDPGRSADPFAVVGIELDMDTGKIKVKLARQFIKTKYGIVADYLLTVRKQLRPNFIGIETNNRGKKVLKLFHEKYNLKIAGIFTSANLTAKTMERGETMDKPFMVKYLKEQLQNNMIEFPPNPSEDMAELLRQINEFVGIRNPSGHTTYKAMRGRHDDLIMSLLLCCHMARLYVKRQEMTAAI